MGQILAGKRGERHHLSAATSIVLASASGARATLLANAGVSFLIDPAHVDEAVIKESCRRQGKSAEDAALVLARSKAETVSLRHAGTMVVGADQILEIEGRWLTKAADRAQAAQILRAWRGRTHRLVSAVAVARDGEALWSAVDSTRLTMRAFSDAFLESYLDALGDSVRLSVGAYRLEDAGVQLFSRIDGDYFTVLGLPLLPLLDCLRENGLIEA